MTTTELKQRISECLDPHGKIFSVGMMADLLRDCLKHIEELEEKIHKLESAKVWTRLDQLQSQFREREADCAAMRLCLEKSNNVFHKLLLDDWLNMRKQALSTTAGRELLERLQKAEGVLLKIREIGELANWHKCSDHAWPEWCVMNVVNEALQPKEAK